MKDIIEVLKGQTTPRVPFWLMRQAGRYLPEYRRLRAGAGSFLNLCFTPERAAAVTLQPLARFDMDAAILFSDILTVPYALGQALDFVEGEGPRLGPLPDKLVFDEKKLDPVYEAAARVRGQLAPDKTLIGFAGAPWTLACYMIEGGGDGHFRAACAAAHNGAPAFARLIDTLTDATILHLAAQIRAGAEVVQIFDSWAGLLPEAEFRAWVISPTKKIVDGLRAACPGVPVIGFPRGAGALYQTYAAETGIDGLSLDPQASLAETAQALNGKTCLQGNLDPEILRTGGEKMERETRRILESMHGKPFIFNLGHGVIKETPPEHVARLAEIVRSIKL